MGMGHLQVCRFGRNGCAIELDAGFVMTLHQIVFMATGSVEGEAFSRTVAEKQYPTKAEHQATYIQQIDIHQIDGGQGKLCLGLLREFIE